MEQQARVLKSHMFIVKKRSGEYNAQVVAGGNKQRDYLSKEDSSSPTAATELVLLTSIVDAKEKRDVAIINIPNAFIQTVVEDKKDQVIMRIQGVIVNMLVRVAPDVYAQYVTDDKRGNKQLLVECMNAIYGTMVARLLYCCEFAASLTKKGFNMNPYNPCVWNKEIDGKQCTVCFHVNNCKISHVRSSVVDNIIKWLQPRYESIFTDGSGKLKVSRGKVHKYLGMTLDFSPKFISNGKYDQICQ
jgi:hypothetical protein